MNMMLKSNFLRVLILMASVLGFSSQSNASGVTPEDIGSMYVVEDIDYKKRLIKLGGGEIAYSASTEFFDSKGDISSIDNLRKGGAITFFFDQNKRFFLRPTATKIWIK